MSKLALMFLGKFHCSKTINVRKKNIVKFRATASSRIGKIFRLVIYIRKNWYKVKCVKSARTGRIVSEV